MIKRKGCVECIAIFICIEKNKENALKIAQIIKKYGCVGCKVGSGVDTYALFRKEDKENVKLCYEELQKSSIQCAILSNTCYVEKKYLEEDKLFNSIKEMFGYYGNDLKVTANYNGFYVIESDLGGKKICCNYRKNQFLIIGMENGKMLTTKKPKQFGKQMLLDFEKQIIEWRENHTGCRKVLENELSKL